MTRIKGIEGSQVISEIFLCIIYIACAMAAYSVYMEEKNSFNFSRDNETIHQIIFIGLLCFTCIQLVCLFKKMGNYIEIKEETLAFKSFQLFQLTSATTFAEIEYKDIKAVNLEKKGITKWLVINTASQQYKINIKDVEQIMPIIKSKAGLK